MKNNNNLEELITNHEDVCTWHRQKPDEGHSDEQKYCIHECDGKQSDCTGYLVLDENNKLKKYN